MSEFDKICKEQEVQENSDVELLQDGKPVPMVPFVTDVVRNVVLGLVKSLHGVDPEANITINIKKGSK